VVQRICGQRRFRKKNITIFSDNQAAVRWAGQLGPGQGQHLSRKLHDIALQQHQRGGSLQVEWVPGHCEVDGNEKANALAKAGVNNIGKNAISLGEVDDLLELIQARRLGLGNFFLLTLDALDRSINASLDGLERTSIKRGLTNFFSLEPRCEPR
jgi:hypothetical protein